MLQNKALGKNYHAKDPDYARPNAEKGSGSDRLMYFSILILPCKLYKPGYIEQAELLFRKLHPTIIRHIQHVHLSKTY